MARSQVSRCETPVTFVRWLELSGDATRYCKTGANLERVKGDFDLSSVCNEI